MFAKKILSVVCVALLGGMLSVSIYSIPSLPMKASLIGLFLFCGYFVRFDIWRSFLAFVFLYPLIPSHPQLFGLGAFEYAEFVFVCFSFWWAVTKFRADTTLPDQKWILRFALLFISVAFISSVMAILRDNLIFTPVFLLKLKEQPNILIPSSPVNMLFSLQALVHMAEGLLFLIITLDVVNRRERVLTTVKAMLFSATFVASLGILQYIFRFKLLEYWVKENPNIVRINSTMDDPNSLGTYLATLLSIGAFASFAPGAFKNRKDYFACLALILLALAMTVSRAAIGAVFVVFFLIPLIATLTPFSRIIPALQKFKPFSKAGWIAIVLFLLLVMVAYFVNVTNRQPGTIVEVVLYTLNPNLPLNEVLKGRLDFWKSAFHVFTKFPLLGCGPGMSPTLLNEYGFPGIKQENIHNYFLQLLSEIGVIGLVLFLFIQIQVLRMGLRNLRSPDTGPVRFAIFCGWSAFLLTSITGHPLLLPKMQFLFWGICGLLITVPTTPNSSTTIKKDQKILDLKFVLLATGFLSVVALLGIRSVLRERNITSYEYGYHRWEQSPEGPFFRWTKGEALSVVKARGKILNLSFRQSNPNVVEKNSNVEIYVNESLLTRVPIRNTTWNDWEFYLPEMKVDELITLRIKPSVSFRPVEFGSSDSRVLGIAMRNIDWKCSSNLSETGVYEWENAGGRIFRWTMKQSSYFLTPERSHLTFSMLPNQSVFSQPVQAEFFWNDQRIHQIDFSQNEWQPVALQIPQQSSSPGVLTIRSSNFWNPTINGQSGDNRDLALAITSFAWEGLPLPLSGSKQITLMRESHVLGIFNHQNQLYRLRSYISSGISLSPQLQIFREGTRLSYDPELMNFSNDQASAEQRIYPKENEEEAVVLTFFTRGEYTTTTRLNAGRYLLRFKARAMFAGNEAPLLGVRWNDQAGTQPIISDDWQNYFYEVSCLKDGEQKINVKYLNDLYDPTNRVDRNIFIVEISVFPNRSGDRSITGPEAASRWSYQPETHTIFVTEPASYSIFFPDRHCYTVGSP